MAAAAQVEIPDTVAIPTRVDLFLNPDGRLGGIAGNYGSARGNLNRGRAYWSASVDYAAKPRAVFEDGLRMEALLTRVQRGQTLRVPAYRWDKWRAGYAYRDAQGNDLPASAVAGTLAVATGGMRFSGLTYVPQGGGTGNARVFLKAGCMFTVNNVLYQYDGTAGDPLDATSANLSGVYPDPVFSAGDAVELAAPYFVGILQEGSSIRLARAGGRFGPWTVEDLVEISRA